MSENIFLSAKIKTLLNSKQVADALGIKEETLQIWRSTKRYNLPYIKIGGRVRYTVEDVEKFIHERTIPLDTIG